MYRFVVVLALFGAVLGLPTNSTNKNVGPRIVGGEATDIAHNPWQLALLYRSQHYCGAVEIHPSWALTAANCLEGVAVDYLSVRAGSTTKSFGGQVIDVIRIYSHPEYNIRTIDYNFGLIQLDEPITVQTAAPIALPEPNSEILNGETAVITGWGGVAESGGVSPEILHLVEVPIVDNEICQLLYQYQVITNRMFCAGDLDNGGKDACGGDGGGPVIVNGRLAGLVSWGTGCGRRNTPGVHAKVSSVLEWIYQTTGI